MRQTQQDPLAPIDDWVLDLMVAMHAGHDWARSLAVGDVFLGAMPAAEAAGYLPGTRANHIFVSAALDILDTYSAIVTDRITNRLVRLEKRTS